MQTQTRQTLTRPTLTQTRQKMRAGFVGPVVHLLGAGALLPPPQPPLPRLFLQAERSKCIRCVTNALEHS
jgi:hypothetical protein